MDAIHLLYNLHQLYYIRGISFLEKAIIHTALLTHITFLSFLFQRGQSVSPWGNHTNKTK